MRTSKPSFFITAGTLQADAPCYVERVADGALLEALRTGELCYVLTSRQTGKSSLMIRTATRLRAEGVRVVLLDLTLIGQQLSPEQWYRGLLEVLAEQLDLEDELDEFWAEHAHLGNARRWLEAIVQVALPRCAGGLVLFVDEVDAVQALPFSTDEFFAAVRACYNRRAADPALSRLTFCLLGVASPADLIQDPRNTPFNIGRRIELTDFTPEEAAPLAQGLENGGVIRSRGEALALLARVLFWTGGHPSLTQQLCKAVSEAGDTHGARDVDRCCEALFLAPGVRRREEQFRFIEEWLLRSGVDLAALLDLYGRLRSGRAVEDQPSRIVELLRLAGMVRATDGHLRVRNRIYAQVFDRAWIARHLPDAEARRQRAAFRRGALRTGAVAALLLSLLGAVAAVSVTGEAKSRHLANARQALIQERDQLLARNGATLDELRASKTELEATIRKLRAQEREARWQTTRATESEANERRQRQAAESARAVAELQQKLATGLRHESEARRRQIRRQLVRLQITAGQDAVAAGRPLDALPLFVAALQAEAGDRERAKEHRIRIASLLNRCPQLLHLWPGNGKITQVKFSPDGRYAAFAQDNGAVAIHDSASGRQIGPLIRHLRSIRGIAFSPDSRWVASTSDDNTVQVRRVGASRAAFVTATSEPMEPLFSRDGRRLFVSHWNGAVHEFDPASGATRGLVFQIGSLHHLYYADEQFVLGAVGEGRDGLLGTLYVWDLRSKRFRASRKDAPAACTVSPDGRLLAGSATDGLRAWTLPDLEPAGPLVTGGRHVVQLRFAPDSRRVTAVSNQGWVREWDVLTGASLGEPVYAPASPLQVAIAPDRRRIIVADHEGVLRLWDTARADRPGLELRPPVPSGFPGLSPDRRQVGLGGEDGVVRIWSTETGRITGPTIRHPGRIYHVALAHGRVATAVEGGAPRLWDVRTGKSVGPRFETPAEQPPGEDIDQVAFDPTGRWLFGQWGESRAVIYDGATGRIISPTFRDTNMSETVNPFSTDGRQLLMPEDWRRWLYTLQDGRFVLARKIHAADASTFSPDGRLLLGTGVFTGKQLQRAADGKPVGPVFTHRSYVALAEFSPDGRRIVTSSHDGRIYLWDTRTAQPLQIPLEHDGVRGVAFSRDGQRLATMDMAGNVQVWNTSTGEPITLPLSFLPMLKQVAFGVDKDHVLGLHDLGTASIWRLEPDRRSVADLVALSEVLCGQRLTQTGALGRIEPKVVAHRWQRLRRRYPAEFSPSPRRDVNWHQRKALAYGESHHWTAAIPHLDWLLAADPQPWDLYWHRARAYAESGEWGAAARDLAVLVRRGRSEPLAFHDLALAQLGAGDLAGYRRTCSAMLSRFAESANVRARDFTSWTCALGPIDPAAMQRPLQLAQSLLTRSRHPNYLGTLGGLLYRAGRSSEALTILDEAKQARQSDGTPVDLFLYGLACQAVGRRAEATVCLERGNRALDELTHPGSGQWHDWQSRLEAQLLRDELTTVLR